jgi:hypothetical protein
MEMNFDARFRERNLFDDTDMDGCGEKEMRLSMLYECGFGCSLSRCA